MKNYFLLLEREPDKRIYKSIDTYDDITGKEYNYDSKVPNSKQVSQGDIVIIRKENLILGHGRISQIDKEPGIKKHLKCDNCLTTEISFRKTLKPEFKCRKCFKEIEEPIVSYSDITKFKAHIEGFTKFEVNYDFREFKKCSKSGKVNSQSSMLLLVEDKLTRLLGDDFINQNYNQSKDKLLDTYLNILEKVDKIDETDEDRSTQLRRKEHYYANKYLFYNKESEKCSCCHRKLPINLLTCAHIKKRSLCSENERKDITNIVFPMCNLGCDRLYELGYIYVNKNGKFQINKNLNLNELDLNFLDILTNISGNKCLSFKETNAHYFKYHKKIYNK